jgi:ankyrin repeat protein
LIGEVDRFTVMMACARQGNATIMQALLEHDTTGAVNKRSVTGWCALDFAAANNRIDMVRIMLKHGADVNLHNGVDGRQPLFSCASEKAFEMIELLLVHGANPLHVDDKGGSALHLAAYQQHIKSVELMLDAGGDINQANTKGATLLHMCAKFDLQVMAEYLLKRGASVDMKARSGRTASDTADRYSKIKISGMIQAEGVRRAQCIAVAFCMGLHERLGQNSHVRSLDEGVARMILDYV